MTRGSTKERETGKGIKKETRGETRGEARKETRNKTKGQTEEEAREEIGVVDFGSQYTQLIARRLRELGVYARIYPYNSDAWKRVPLKGLVLSGGPASVRSEKAPTVDLSLHEGKVPILGLCYGAQHLVHQLGGQVRTVTSSREYGAAELSLHGQNELTKNLVGGEVWMSHGDSVNRLPQGFEGYGSTQDVTYAAFGSEKRQLYGLQFHPEVSHTKEGAHWLRNFARRVCGCTTKWLPTDVVGEKVQELRERVGSESVLMGLSGGVDSSVAAYLLKKAIGHQLHCFFIDTGLLRKNEAKEVLNAYQRWGLKVRFIDAKEQFFHALKGTKDPEEKRKIIGRVFVELFNQEAQKHKDMRWLGQGTIYPDVIESVSVSGPSHTIKSHHNVGGLPKKMSLKVVEPLNDLFKDEVRVIGKHLGLPDALLERHPFPGPGLGIRILGEVSKSRVQCLQEVDAIFVQALKEEGFYDEVWQAGAMLLPVRSVGVMGDQRTYEQVVALRAVSSQDGMTAQCSHLPLTFLEKVAHRIINEVKGVNRVVYDLSSKPPATIEWE